MKSVLVQIAILIFLTHGALQGQHTNKVISEIDSLKTELSKATDSLVVADLCYSLYRKYTFDIKTETSDTPYYLFRALKIYETTTEFGKLADVYNALAGFHYNRQLLDMAREYWIESSKNYEKSGNDLQVAKSFNNLSLAYSYEDSAKLGYILKAIEISITIGDSTILGSAYNNLSAYYKANHDYVKAEAYLISSIKTAENIGKTTTQQAGYFDLGNLKKIQGQSDEAIAYIEKSLTFDAIRSTDPNVMGAYKALVELYEDKGDFDKAFHYQRLWMNAKDTLFDSQTNQKLLSLTAAYEIENQELIIAAQQSEIELLDKENELKNQRFIFIGLILLIGFFIVYLWKSRQFSRRRAQLQKVFAQDLITNVEEERKRISSELHDGVGQQLILLKNQARVEANEEMENTASATLEEVRNITRDLHPAILDRLGLTAAIEELVHKLDESTGIFFSTVVESVDGVFSREQELNIYRIAQESLNNLVKHAEAISAKLTLEKLQDRVVLKIQDNGVGFDAEKAAVNTTSLGLKTLQERASMLKAQLKIDSGQSGTIVTLTVPC